MREIKFRAWDNKEKCMMNISKLHFGKKILVEHDKSNWDWYQKEVPIMQYTGLKERYNLMNPPEEKEIYEGDIIQSDGWEGIYYIVGFEEGQFVAKGSREVVGLHALLWPVVVGNIYENPELLEGVK